MLTIISYNLYLFSVGGLSIYLSCYINALWAPTIYKYGTLTRDISYTQWFCLVEVWQFFRYTDLPRRP